MPTQLEAHSRLRRSILRVFAAALLAGLIATLSAHSALAGGPLYTDSTRCPIVMDGSNPSDIDFGEYPGDGTLPLGCIDQLGDPVPPLGSPSPGPQPPIGGGGGGGGDTDEPRSPDQPDPHEPAVDGADFCGGRIVAIQNGQAVVVTNASHVCPPSGAPGASLYKSALTALVTQTDVQGHHCNLGQVAKLFFPIGHADQGPTVAHCLDSVGIPNEGANGENIFNGDFVFERDTPPPSAPGGLGGRGPGSF